MYGQNSNYYGPRQGTPQTPQREGMLPPIERTSQMSASRGSFHNNGDSYLKNGTIQNKVRELELQFIDLQGEQTRNLFAIKQELTQQMEKEIKSFKFSLENSNKNLNQNFSNNSGMQTNFNANVSNQLEVILTELSQMKSKFSQQDFKISETVRSLQQVNNNLLVQGINLTDPIQSQGNNSQLLINFHELDQEIKLLRGQLLDERNKREQNLSEQNLMINQMQSQIQQSNQETLQRMQQYRDNQFQITQEGINEKSIIEAMKQEQNQQDIGIVRNLINSNDRKINEESQNRLRSIDEIRNYFEQKFVVVQERLTYEESQILEREKRLMNHFQSSVQSITEIAHALKENTQKQIGDINQIISENYQDLITTISSSKQQYELRQKIIEQNIQEVYKRSETVHDQSLRHAKVTNETLNREVNRLEKVVSTLETYQQQQIDSVKKTVLQLQQNQDAWNEHNQNTLGLRVDEAFDSVKKISEDIIKIQEDNQEFRVGINKTVKLHEVVIENKFKDVRMQNDIDRKSMSEIVQMSVKNLKSNGDTERELVQSPKDVQQLIKDMGFLRQELMLHAETISARNMERIMHEKTQSELLLEGRSQQFAIGLEKKYEEIFNQFKDDVLRQQGERNIRFNEQYKEFDQTIQKSHLDLDGKLAKIELKEQDQRKWMEMQKMELVRELNTLISKRLSEQEIILKNMAARGDFDGQNGEPRDKELKAKKERNLMEYLDISLKNQHQLFMTLFEDERSKKNFRISEISNLIQHHKELTDEHIMQWGESLKALLKAKVTTEFTETRRELEQVTESLNQRVDSLQRTMESRISLENDKQNSKIDAYLSQNKHKVADVKMPTPHTERKERIEKLQQDILTLAQRVVALEEINLEAQGKVLEEQIQKDGLEVMSIDDDFDGISPQIQTAVEEIWEQIPGPKFNKNGDREVLLQKCHQLIGISFDPQLFDSELSGSKHFEFSKNEVAGFISNFIDFQTARNTQMEGGKSRVELELDLEKENKKKEEKNGDLKGNLDGLGEELDENKENEKPRENEESGEKPKDINEDNKEKKEEEKKQEKEEEKPSENKEEKPSEEKPSENKEEKKEEKISEEKKEDTPKVEDKKDDKPTDDKKDEKPSEEQKKDEKKDEKPSEEQKKDEKPTEEQKKDEKPTEEQKKDEKPTEEQNKDKKSTEDIKPSEDLNLDKAKIEQLKTEDEKKLDTFANQVQDAIDLIWDEHDADNSGFLSKEESKDFVKNTLKYLDASRIAEFDGSKFDEKFKEWDTDGNGVIQKSEMATFVLEVFKS